MGGWLCGGPGSRSIISNPNLFGYDGFMAGKRTDKFVKFGPLKREKYLGLLRKGGRRYRSARTCGVSLELVRLYRKEHPEFAAAEEEAEREANEVVEDALFKAAKKGNVAACKLWLYNRDPQRWKDRGHFSVESLTDEELITLVLRERARTGATGLNGNGHPALPNGTGREPGPEGQGTNGPSS
jgi:hypothetical protein